MYNIYAQYVYSKHFEYKITKIEIYWNVFPKKNVSFRKLTLCTLGFSFTKVKDIKDCTNTMVRVIYDFSSIIICIRSFLICYYHRDREMHIIKIYRIIFTTVYHDHYFPTTINKINIINKIY